MNLINGDSYKKIEEFKITQTESDAKSWPPMEMPVVENIKGIVNIKTKYKDGYILYMSTLEIKDIKLNNKEFRIRNHNGAVIINFNDKDGFATDSIVKLPINEGVSDYTVQKDSVRLYWESKIPSTLKNYESIVSPSLQWAGFRQD